MMRSIGARPRGVYRGKRYRAPQGPVRVSREIPSVTAATAAATSAAGHAARRHGAARPQVEPAHHGETPHHALALARGALHRDRGATDIALELPLALVTAVLVDRHHGSSRIRLLTAPLDVALHELLGVLLEDVVDLVQEVVEILLDLLPL